VLRALPRPAGYADIGSIGAGWWGCAGWPGRDNRGGVTLFSPDFRREERHGRCATGSCGWPAGAVRGGVRRGVDPAGLHSLLRAAAPARCGNRSRTPTSAGTSGTSPPGNASGSPSPRPRRKSGWTIAMANSRPIACMVVRVRDTCLPDLLPGHEAAGSDLVLHLVADLDLSDPELLWHLPEATRS